MVVVVGQKKSVSLRHGRGPRGQGSSRCPVWRKGQGSGPAVPGVRVSRAVPGSPCGGGLKDFKLRLEAEELQGRHGGPAAREHASPGSGCHGHPLHPQHSPVPAPAVSPRLRAPDAAVSKPPPGSDESGPREGVVCVCVGRTSGEWRQAQTAQEAESGRAPLRRQRSMGDGRFGSAGRWLLPRALPQEHQQIAPPAAG